MKREVPTKKIKDVILNGGEAVVRNPTTAKAVDDVDGNTRDARSFETRVLLHCPGQRSFGPSEGLCPPQDDIALG
jgi:hypothetical protein